LIHEFHGETGLCDGRRHKPAGRLAAEFALFEAGVGRLDLPEDHAGENQKKDCAAHAEIVAHGAPRKKGAAASKHERRWSFLTYGLMQYGSVYGHGARLGPDFTAD
jgi:hypothetical protein